MTTRYLAFVLLGAATMGSVAKAGTLLFATTQGGVVSLLDPVTGAVVQTVGQVTPISSTLSLIGLATSNNHLYALDSNSGDVIEIDTNPSNSAATLNVFNIGLGASAITEGDVTFGGTGANFNGSGTFYFSSAVFNHEQFYSGTLTNSTTGTEVLLKDCTTNPCPSGEARVVFDGLSFTGGTLYGLQQGGAGLYTIDPATGKPTLSGTTGLAAGNANGALTTDNSGQLYGVLSNNIGFSLYTFTTSGTPTLIGTAGNGALTNVTGLAFIDTGASPVPEPSAVFLTAAALLFLRRVRAGRRS